jgi:glycosyltransferase involved in cell wall biosynthesis
MGPLISIALCTYNGAAFLQQQVDSILQQSYPYIELVISDDASTDETLSVLKKYEADTRVKIFYNQHNAGLTSNIQFAVNQCSGSYIAFADQDDIWKPQKLEVLYKAIGEAWLVYSDSELVSETGQPLNKKLSDLRRLQNGNETLGYAYNNCVWGHTVLFKKELLNYLLPIPADLPHDSWAGFTAAAIDKIKYVNQPLHLYRQHSGTSTQTIAQKHVSNAALKIKDYNFRKKWLQALASFPHSYAGKPLHQQLYFLYLQKENAGFSMPLFLFLIRHRKKIFAVSKKNIISQFVEIRKMARGIMLPL